MICTQNGQEWLQQKSWPLKLSSPTLKDGSQDRDYPWKLLPTTDNNFKRVLIIFKLKRINSILTPQYHPQANGGVEYFKQTFKNDLKTHLHEGLLFSKAVTAVLQHYRSTPHSSIGELPAKLMIGHHLQRNFAATKKVAELQNLLAGVKRYLVIVMLKEMPRQFQDNFPPSWPVREDKEATKQVKVKSQSIKSCVNPQPIGTSNLKAGGWINLPCELVLALDTLVGQDTPPNWLAWNSASSPTTQPQIWTTISTPMNWKVKLGTGKRSMWESGRLSERAIQNIKADGDSQWSEFEPNCKQE